MSFFANYTVGFYHGKVIYKKGISQMRYKANVLRANGSVIIIKLAIGWNKRRSVPIMENTRL
jgi:hypothetical protein